MNDDIVEEVRRVRQEHSAKFNYDVDAIFEDLRRLEQEQQQPVVSLTPRPAAQDNARKLLEQTR